jgi:endonuclease/exonuclease/phosphatase (EEP) superfamily protein YafD
MNWRITFQIIGVIAALLSLIPLVVADYWWIRAFDFPHLQFMFFTLLAIILFLFTFKWRWINDYIYLTILLGCFTFQFFKVVEFTPLVPVEVNDSSENVPKEDQLVIYTSNVLQTNTESENLFSEIAEKNPDLIVFTETNDTWMQVIRKNIGADYPYKVEQPQENTYGIILYSKLPLREYSVQFLVDPKIPSIHAQAQMRNGKWFQLYAIHPTPPMPQHNPSSSDRDTELMRTAIMSYQSELPVILLGDFNDVAWADSTELTTTIGKLLNLRVGRGFYNTFHAQYPILRWSLDHIFVSSEFRLTDAGVGVDIESDHFPMYATLTFEPDLADEQRATEPTEEEWKLARDQMSEQGMETFTELPSSLKKLMDK